ncbi:heme NO-binding domain-containing protein [Litorivivens sp.]|uniref:heme NO-binding domain-containing protein n=1 Tax=Litorivivens sp. TaxID=2020868 RepID=UPI00356643AB
MKGIVFTEFMEMVDEKFSPEMTESLLDEVDLESGGVYTSVATYDHGEIVSLVGKLSEKTDIPVPTLIQVFGEYLLERFTVLYPAFFEGVTSTFSFLDSIENHVHIEVKKLYNDAELPTFKTEKNGDLEMTMIYQSQRPFADLAEGLIRGSVAFFGEEIRITREDLGDCNGSHAKFRLEKVVA